MNPLEANPMLGFAANPLLLTGLQILNNSRRGSRQGTFEGVPQALMLANQNQYMMQRMQQAQAEQDYMMRERQRAEAERQGASEAFGKIGNVLQAQQQWQKGANVLDANGGGPMPSPRPTIDVMGTLLNSGNPALAQTALSQLMKPEEFTNVAEGGVSYGSRGTVLKGPPKTDTGMLSKGYKAALAQGLQPNTPEFAAFAKEVDMRVGGANSSPYFTYQPMTDSAGNMTGIIKLDARGGPPSRVEIPGMDTVMRPQDNPFVQGSIAGAKRGASVAAEAREQARIDLPTVEQQGRYTTDLLQRMIDHPGRKSMTGASSMLMPSGGIPGQPSADFAALKSQIQGQQFLQAYQTLKGGGQITEVEGQKAEQAIARMQTSQTEQGFIDAAKELQAIIQQGVNRAKNKAGALGAGGANPGGATVSNW